MSKHVGPFKQASWQIKYIKRSILIALLLVSLTIPTLSSCSKTDGMANATDYGSTEEAVAAVTFYPAAEAFAGGTGTADDPYQISTAGELALLSEMFTSDYYWESDEWKHYTSAYYELIEDITLNDPSTIDSWDTEPPTYVWRPIGEREFSGTFDGNGHTIRGLYLTTSWLSDDSGSSSRVGLFGQTQDATIRNVVVEQSFADVARGNMISFGGIVGEARDSIIEGCDVNMSPELKRSCDAGGIVGHMYNGSIVDCSFSGVLQVPEHASVGGIAGVVTSPDLIEGVTNYGDILSAAKGSNLAHAGGIVGHVMPGADSTIRGCKNSGSVITSGADSGGLFGVISIDWDAALGDEGWDYAASTLTVEDCINEGTVTTTDLDDAEATGGIVSMLYNSSDRGFDEDEGMSITLSRCVNSGDVSSDGMAGGVLGSASSVVTWTVNECVNSGTISASSSSGGIVGEAEPGAAAWSIVSCINEGDVISETGKAAGILAELFGFTTTASGREADMLVDRCTNRGSISCKDSIYGSGGIVGSISATTSKLTVASCINEGEVHGEGSCRLGGIVGSTAFSSAQGNNDGFVLDGCVNRGAIVHGAGDVTFEEAYEYTVAKAGNHEEIEAGDAATLLLGGLSLGGVIGYCNGGVVENCVNLGEIRLSQGQSVVITNKGYQGESGREESATAMWCGGICGQFVALDEDTLIQHCVSVDTAPLAVAPTLYEANVVDVKLLSRDDAEQFADGLVI